MRIIRSEESDAEQDATTLPIPPARTRRTESVCAAWCNGASWSTLSKPGGGAGGERNELLGTRATATGERRRRGIGWPPCPAVAAARARARRTPNHLTLPGAAGRSINIDLQTDSGGAGTGKSGPVGRGGL